MITVDTDAEPTYWAGDEPENALYVHRFLDAWKTNPDLHRYYEERSFEFVRTAGDESDPSSVCYQRDAEIQLEAGPRVIGAES